EELDHLPDRSDPSDGFFRKRKTESNRADNLSVDVNRRAGHASKHARLLNVSATQSRNNRRLAWTWKSRQDAEDLDAEFFSSGAAKDCLRSPLHSRSKIFERKQFRS